MNWEEREGENGETDLSRNTVLPAGQQAWKKS